MKGFFLAPWRAPRRNRCLGGPKLRRVTLGICGLRCDRWLHWRGHRANSELIPPIASPAVDFVICPCKGRGLLYALEPLVSVVHG